MPLRLVYGLEGSPHFVRRGKPSNMHHLSLGHALSNKALGIFVVEVHDSRHVQIGDAFTVNPTKVHELAAK